MPNVRIGRFTLFLILWVVVPGCERPLAQTGQFSTLSCQIYTDSVIVIASYKSSNWRNEVKNIEEVRALFDRAMQFADRDCRAARGSSAPITYLSLSVSSPENIHVLRLVKNRSSQFSVEWDNRTQAARTEDKLRSEREELNTRQKELEKLRKVAEKDCGSMPQVSGGPWFSSTYKVAAHDAAKRLQNGFSGFFCIKRVEYISEAPNPFGGKAARARFIGYNLSLQTHEQIFDFPY